MTDLHSEGAVCDPARLAALRATDLLDRPAEAAFDRLTHLAAKILRVPVALVSLVDEDRQFFPSCVGLPEPYASQRETPLSHSFCQHIVGSAEPLVIEDARKDPLLRENLAIRVLDVVAYAGIPLVASEGHVLGSFCVIDHQPRRWTEAEIDVLTDLAASVMAGIELRRMTREAEARAEESKALSEQLQRANEDLVARSRDAEQARAAADEANRSKSQFLAAMSHELRTPLNAIGGYVELLEMGLRGPVTDAQRVDLERIRRSQQRLLGLINAILNFSRVDAGQVQYHIETVPPGEMLDGLGAMIGPQAVARSLTYVCRSCPPGLQVRADREKAEQVVLNLLSNAVKFTAPGGRIDLWCEAGDATVAIRVRDTGVGIPADKLAAVFEPFVQLDQSLTRMAEGTGLGLAISRDLARGMGGDLAVESASGEGSTFTLTLPRGPAADAEPGEKPSSAAEAGTASLDVVGHCRELLGREGVQGVLRFLNGRTEHRFTGVYRLDPPMLRNLRLVDREDPALEVGADAPMRETYCAIVGATQQPFATADTTRDERLREHPAREAVQSYCGALLRDARGEPFGTLCHFDVQPCPVPASEIPVLEALAPLIAAALREEERDAHFRGSAAAG